jgi:hypothetical protein
MPEDPGRRPDHVVDIRVRPAEEDEPTALFFLHKECNGTMRGSWIETLELTWEEYTTLKTCLSAHRSRSKVREIAHA